ncbi:MAG: hypothetical protein EPN46_10395 [Candidimonas sp.]|nr:MAG: hypothetical protein EPN77_16835 [Candidimonas sp.]TAM26675.1 MAG: hypothetical protein EPN62_01440 [Candidimonas sp.]TAM75382.1 MAG: hypothetical protein EPN46_10395 [Candidimonas sp.]
MATETIDHSTLSRLVEAGAVRGAHVVGQPGGWAVIVKYGMHERPLASTNSRAIRSFRRLETLVAYLKNIGLSQFDVDAANYDQAAPTAAKRPDRAAALKRAHEAAAYDKWFRAQVQKELDDPSPELTDEEANADMRQFFAKLEREASH